MQFAKILSMLDRGDIQRPPRIVGLMLDDGDAIDRGQEVLRFGIARVSIDLRFVAQRCSEPLRPPSCRARRHLCLFPAGRHSNFTNSRVGCLTQVNVPSPQVGIIAFREPRGAPMKSQILAAIGETDLQPAGSSHHRRRHIRLHAFGHDLVLLLGCATTALAAGAQRGAQAPSDRTISRTSIPRLRSALCHAVLFNHRRHPALSRPRRAT
jgi:hypothetical protein